MAIILNDNTRVNAGKPVDAKYLNLSNKPYVGIAEVNTTISVPERHIGLTVNINGIEHWYKDNVFDGDLVIKSTASGGMGTITGATNIGFFQGTDTIQSINIITIGILPDYKGKYDSLYNIYYRDSDGVIRIGIPPSDNIGRRGYVYEVPTSGNVPQQYKSWVWNERIDGFTGEKVGWILINGHLDNFIGQYVPGVLYYQTGLSDPYLNTSWTDGYSEVIDRLGVEVGGDLSSGNPLTIGGPVYSRTILNDTTLELRTIKSTTPTRLNVDFDDAFVNLGVEQVVGQNLTSTATGLLYSGVNDNTLQFRRIRGAGDAVVTTSGNDVIISSVAGGASFSGITSGGNLGGGIGVFSNVNGNIIEFNTIVGSGDTTVSLSSDTIIVHSKSDVGTITGATNGLSVYNDIDIGLGGELVQPTIIDAGGNDFTISDVGMFDLSATTINFGGTINISEPTAITSEAFSVLVRDDVNGHVKTVEGSQLGEDNNNYFITTASTSITATTEMYIILVDSSAVAVTITLPATPVAGQAYKIKDATGDAISNIITIDGAGKDIDNSSSFVINTDYGAIEIVYDANFNEWFVLSFVN